MKKNLVMLAILDGFGINPVTKGNAVYAAKKPNLDYLMRKYPTTTLGASGEDVGLPDGQMGNSEVGHLNIGAGRIVYQSLTRVNIAVRNDELINMPVVRKAINNAKKNNGKLHIMGLLSDGGVHSHIDHILYLLEKGVLAGVKEVVVHAFLDGRDVPPKSAKEYLAKLDQKVKEVGNAKVGVVSGRYYAMDRDKNWNRVQLAYDALVYNKAELKDVLGGIDESYANDVTDEFVVPYIANKDSNIVLTYIKSARFEQISTAYSNYILTVHSFFDDYRRFIEEMILDSVDKQGFWRLNKSLRLYCRNTLVYIRNVVSERRELEKSIKNNGISNRKAKEWMNTMIREIKQWNNATVNFMKRLVVSIRHRKKYVYLVRFHFGLMRIESGIK